MNIVYEDKYIIVVKKNAGQLTQSGKNFDLDLTSEILAYRKNKNEDVYAALINRLDRPVSGLVLFAKNKQTAARLSKQMQQGAFCKHYYAVICGKLSCQNGRFVDYLVKDVKSNTSSVVSEAGNNAKRAELYYELIRELPVAGGMNTVSEESAAENKDESVENVLSLVKIRLVTGRHHQIRVQFASRGLPLLGDTKYGAMQTGIVGIKDTAAAELSTNDSCGRRAYSQIKLGRNEIALCAYELSVDDKVFEIKPDWLNLDWINVNNTER